MRDKIINGISHYFLLILTEKCVSLIVFCSIIMYLSSKISHQKFLIKYLSSNTSSFLIKFFFIFHAISDYISFFFSLLLNHLYLTACLYVIYL